MRSLAASLALAALAAAGPAGHARAQNAAGTWRAIPVIGAYVYDRATPFETAPLLGGEVHYAVTPALSLGFGIAFARPKVDGSYFPLVLFKVSADTSILYRVGQQVTQVAYLGLATLALPLGRASVYAQGGLGGYTFFVDPQVMKDMLEITRESTLTGLLVPVAAGLSIPVGAGAGFRFEVRDEILTSFDRERLNPVEPRFRNSCDLQTFCIEEANGSPPAPKETNHMLRLTIGFELIPGR